MERIVLHVDMDSFFAACEERENPQLKSKPVIVCVFSGRGEEGGAVSTANYKAREFGVRSGMPIAMAKRMCPEGVFLPVNHELYERVSNDVMAILREHATSFEQVGVDEAFLELTGKAPDYADANRIALKIKSEIWSKLGLTCSIGIGPNKLIAKIASDFKKPDGLTIVEPSHVKDFLAPLGPTKLWGVGKKTTEKLADMGITTVGEIAASDEALLRREFGEVKGHWLKLAAQGIDDEPIQERGESEQIGRMMTLPRDTRDKEFIMGALEAPLKDVHQRLIERDAYFRTLTITAITNDLKAHTRSKSIGAATRDLDVMRQLTAELLSTFLDEMTGAVLRRVGVRVSNLTKRSEQRTLFEF